MPRRQSLKLEEIAEWSNVHAAAHRACRGKQASRAVQCWQLAPETNISNVAVALRSGNLPEGYFESFVIHDPKRRVIHAAPLADRVAHHALMHFVEPVYERVLLPSVYACRKGKGVHRAINAAQQLLRRAPWVMHLDIRHYFPAIDHTVLRTQLRRRFRGDGLKLLDAVIDSFAVTPGKGLPIGALSSQHFANHYLNDADRWCLAQAECVGMVRYMDDYLVVANSRDALLALRDKLVAYLGDKLILQCKPALMQRSDVGVLYCGVKLKPFAMAPGLRRRRRYQQRLAQWEQRYQAGQITADQLQRAADAVGAILLPADASALKSARRQSIDA